MKKTLMDKELDEAVELFESAHYVVPNHDSETGSTQYNHANRPTFRSIRKLKRRYSDYQAGPVKVYTKQEIKEYEDARSI